MMAVDAGMTSLLVVIGFVATYLFVRRMRLLYTMSQFLGPKAYPLIGMLYMFDSDPRAFLKLIWTSTIELTFENPDVKTWVIWVGPVPVISTGCPKDLQIILSSSRHLDKGIFYLLMKPWLGNGLLLNKGKHWQKRRKLLTPSFHFSVLASFINTFNEQAQILSQKLGAPAGEESVNIFPIVTCCTLDIICATAMGKHVGAQQGNNKNYVEAILEMSNLIQERQKYPWQWIDFIYNRSSDGKKHRRYLEILHNMTNSVIKEKLEEKKRTNGTKYPCRKTSTGLPDKRKRLAFLDLLLELHEEDSNFTIDDVRDEVDTFMFAGHDTTAAAISWVLFLLGHHPEVQEKVQKELDEVLGDDRNRHITNEDIQKLQYLGCVIKETLRLYPSVPLIARQLQEDTVLSGVLVPKGTMIVVRIFTLHCDPDYFPNPHLFNPDNFLPENVEGRNPFTYIPFSAGPRNCIGQKFALMEEKVILATLLRRLNFRSLQSVDDVCPTGQLILRPYDGIKMEVKLRQ